MPFYDYICKYCSSGIIHEVFKSIKDESMEKCPMCNSNMTKILGQPIIELKGDCWASDLYSRTKKSETVSEAK